MPETLPGFLIVAGTILFVGSLFRGSLEFKSIKLPKLEDRARMVMMALGITFMITSVVLYYLKATSVIEIPMTVHKIEEPY